MLVVIKHAKKNKKIKKIKKLVLYPEVKRFLDVMFGELYWK